MLNDITSPKGYLYIYIKDIKTNNIKRVIYHNNLITYIGATILSHAIAGEDGYKITHIYGEWVDQGQGYSEGSLNGLEAAKTDTIETMRTPPRNTQYAESPILFASYGSSGEQYNNNQITFAASFNDSNLAGKLLQGAGLIVQLNNKELLYAHSYFPAILIQPNEELLCHWTQEFS